MSTQTNRPSRAEGPRGDRRRLRPAARDRPESIPSGAAKRRPRALAGLDTAARPSLPATEPYGATHTLNATVVGIAAPSSLKTAQLDPVYHTPVG